jgi:hypothetical protein
MAAGRATRWRVRGRHDHRLVRPWPAQVVREPLAVGLATSCCAGRWPSLAVVDPTSKGSPTWCGATT